MIDAHAERTALRRRLIDTRAVERCFEGRPQAFGENVLKLLREKDRRGEETLAVAR
jgi:hypothetical protein